MLKPEELPPGAVESLVALSQRASAVIWKQEPKGVGTTFEDVVQRSFLWAWEEACKKRAFYEALKDFQNCEGYLFSAIVRKGVKQAKQEQAKTITEPYTLKRSKVKEIARNGWQPITPEHMEILRIMGVLSEASRVALELWGQGVGYRAGGSLVGCSPGAFSARVLRARKEIELALSQKASYEMSGEASETSAPMGAVESASIEELAGSVIRTLVVAPETSLEAFREAWACITPKGRDILASWAFEGLLEAKEEERALRALKKFIDVVKSA